MPTQMTQLVRRALLRATSPPHEVALCIRMVQTAKTRDWAVTGPGHWTLGNISEMREISFQWHQTRIIL